MNKTQAINCFISGYGTATTNLSTRTCVLALAGTRSSKVTFRLTVYGGSVDVRHWVLFDNELINNSDVQITIYSYIGSERMTLFAHFLKYKWHGHNFFI
jgi:hypothetical protein